MGGFRRWVAAVLAVLVICSGLVVSTAGPAAGRKVANPGSGFVLKVQNGFMRIKTNSFDFDDEGRVPQCSDGSNNDGGQDGAVDFPTDGQCTSATDDSETQGGFQPKLPIQMTNGTITAAGAVTFPASSVSFPTQYLWVDAPSPVNPFVVTINIIPTHDVSGTINPITGAMSLRIRVRVTLSGGPLAGGCAIGTAATPIDLNSMVTGTTAPPGPNTPISGTPYNPATGRTRLVNNSFSVPGAQGCGTYALFVDLNDQINSNLGLPSPAGNNEAQFTTEFIGTRPQPGVVASFTATPSSGPAPLNVSFSSAGSTQGAGVTYQWDFTNNGSIDAAGATTSFTYPSPGSFTARLRVTDADGDFAETTRLISVGVNQPPTATDQAVSTAEDTARSVTLAGSDPEAGPLTFALAAPAPAHGTLTGTPPNVVYTPAPNYHGPDAFGFRATDNNGGTDTGLVTVNVTPVNDAPVAVSVSGATTEDTPTTVTLVAGDVDGDTLSYAVVTPATKGDVTCSAGGSCSYVPVPDANGTDTFTFRASDPSGALSNVATATVSVTPVNDAPVATDQALTTDEDTPTGITLAATDVDGGTLTFSLLSLPSSGTLTGSPPNLTYTPAPNANGPTSFMFRVTDDSGADDVGTVSVVVIPVNDAPTAHDVAVSTAEDTPVTANIVATDADGDQLTFTPTASSAGGTAGCTGSACTYTPPAGFVGTDTFEVVVEDGNGGSDTAVVTVSVSAVSNTAPVVHDSTVVVIEDTARAFTIVSSDADGDPRTVSVLAHPAVGSLSCSAAGACSYTPATDATGDRTFVVRVEDGRGGVDDATVTLRIAPANDAPVAAPADVATDEDTAAQVHLVATDVDGDPLTWAVKLAPQHGSLSCTAAGACTYAPARDFHGSDSFQVEVSDPHGSRVRITVPVTVSAVDDPPAAGTVSASVAEDGTTTFVLPGSDPDGDTVTFSADPSLLGDLACDAAGSCTFSPDADRNGTDTVAYTVTDGTSTTTGALHLVVVPVNDAPIATGLELTTPEDEPVAFTLPASDVDPGDTLAVTLTSAPAQGWLTGAAPTLTYVPAPQASGMVTFGYSAVDAAGATAQGTVSITVLPVDDAPVAGSPSVATPEDTPIALTLGGTDEEGAVTVTVTDPPDHGTYDGAVYTPAANYHGSDSIGFTVHDAVGQSAAGVATITVVPVNDAPAALDSSVATTRTTPVDLTLGAVDVDGDPLTFTVLTGPGHGTLTGTAPNLTYTPAGLYAGPDAFTFRVTDPSGATSSATVSITVNQGAALPTTMAASPATVTRPGGLLGFLQQYTYNNLSARLATTGGDFAVAGRQVRFVVQGTVICVATTGADGRATCSGKGPRVAASTYQAQFLGDAQFAASSATGALS